MTLDIFTKLSELMSVFCGLYKYYPVEKSIQKVRRQKYEEGHKCLQFSQDLVDELLKSGIQAEIEIGESPTTAKDPKVRHAWVGIWIEPQTGQLVKGYFK